MRIVLVESDLDDNGAIRVSLDRAQRWRQAGADVTVFVVEHSPAASQAAVPPGMDVRYATAVPRRFRWTALAGGLRLARLALSADVVVAGREVHAGLLLASAVTWLVRRPLAVTVQSRPDVALDEYVDDGLRDHTRRALLRADLAVCVAHGLVPVLVGLGLPPARAVAVTNGVDVDAVRSAAAAVPELPLPDLPFVVASGRFHRQKGFDILLEAHARALGDGAPPHTLVLLGEGPDRAALQQLAQQLGVEKSVVLAGFVGNPHAVVARAALFVLPSRWEGYPLALAEALAIGTPVVAADCVSGPREVLDDQRYGQLVPVGDAAALALAITAHLRRPEPLTTRARAGADAARERFDPDVAARAHLDLLAALARRRTAARPPVLQSASRRDGTPHD